MLLHSWGSGLLGLVVMGQLGHVAVEGSGDRVGTYMLASNVLQCYETDCMVPSVRSNKVIIFVSKVRKPSLPSPVGRTEASLTFTSRGSQSCSVN